MKKLLTILCAMVLTVSAQAKDKVFDRPAFRSSSNSLYPAKVELKKKETVVHFHIDCSHWREWSMDGARLECNGQTLAYQTGRIITHEGRRVLADDVFELGKTYGPSRAALREGGISEASGWTASSTVPSSPPTNRLWMTGNH